MVATAANIILLPPPGARRPEGARVEEGSDRPRAAAQPGATSGFAAYAPTGGADRDAGPAPGPRTARRSFADELVGETGKASGTLTFAVQRIAQERLGSGAHFEDWSTAVSAYARTAAGTPEPSGFAA
ncbi:MAG: hypothetical protein JNL71_08135 [Rhodospirillales bacterium]|nr:hypothetical protein [Rhodospirillales bacterium]